MGGSQKKTSTGQWLYTLHILLNLIQNNKRLVQYNLKVIYNTFYTLSHATYNIDTTKINCSK